MHDEVAVKAYHEAIRAFRERPLEPFVFLSGSDCYALRCAVIHQGSDQTDRQTAADALKAFEFVVSGSNSFHMNKMNDKLQLHVPTFCNDICEAVEMWDAQTADNPDITAEKSRMLKIFRT